MDVSAFDEEWEAAVAAAGGWTREVYGVVEGRELVAFCREGRRSDAPVVCLSAGIHGDEPAGPWAVLRLLEEGVLAGEVSWRVVARLNPRGLELGVRGNGEMEDLNRDYLQGQSVEVRAHRAWLEKKGAPDLFLSLHEDWESSGFYLYEISLDGRPSLACEVLEAVEVGGLPREPQRLIDGHAVRELGWIYHAAEPDLPEGWPEAIFLAHQGCPLSLTFETPSALPLERRVGGLVEAVRAALRVWGGATSRGQTAGS